MGSLAAVAAYRRLCDDEPTIPFFSRAWWLDAVADRNGWDVVLVERGGEVRAALPFVLSRRLGLTRIGQPQLTQALGPWLQLSAAKYANRLAEEKELMEGLIDQLPDYDTFVQNWHPNRTNWLPFFWRGFDQTTRYTYVLPDLADITRIWQGLRENIRREINKARRRHALKVRNDLDVEAFLSLNELTFLRQGQRLPYSRDLVRRVDAACSARSCRAILIAEDGRGRQHAGVYVVWDANSAYYLMGGSDPALRTSGAMSLCLWEAITRMAPVTQRFDFEGSVLEPVERFFRAFGAIQTPYFRVTRTPSRLLRARQGFELVRRRL